MVPHKCPVCEGRGKMLASFYGESTNAMEGLVACKSCFGTGVIWDFSTPSYMPYFPYTPPTITPITPTIPPYLPPDYPYTTCECDLHQLDRYDGPIGFSSHLEEREYDLPPMGFASFSN